MLADYYTKPLQGKLFRKMRDVIMGKKGIETFYAMKSRIKERVE